MLGHPDDPEELLAVLLHELAMVKRKQGKLPEAEACLDECEKLELAVSKTSHSQSMALSLLERGLAMRQGGNLERARDCLDKSSITQLNLTANTARLEEALQKQWLSSTLYARGKWLKAKDMLPESREIYHPGHEPWAPVTCEIREICWIDQWLDLDFLQQEYPREAVRQDLGATAVQKTQVELLFHIFCVAKEAAMNTWCTLLSGLK